MPGNNGLFGLHSVFSARTIAVSELFSSPTSLLFSGVPSNESTGGLKIYTLSDQAVTANNTVPAVQGEPAYEDFESLVDVGVSAEQIESLKIALGRYITGTNKPVKKIQVIEVGPAIHSRTSDVDSVTFTVSLDDHMLQAKMEYSGRKVIRLYLSERFGSQQQVFDSGNIGS